MLGCTLVLSRLLEALLSCFPSCRHQLTFLVLGGSSPFYTSLLMSTFGGLLFAFVLNYAFQRLWSGLICISVTDGSCWISFQMFTGDYVNSRSNVKQLRSSGLVAGALTTELSQVIHWSWVSAARATLLCWTSMAAFSVSFLCLFFFVLFHTYQLQGLSISLHERGDLPSSEPRSSSLSRWCPSLLCAAVDETP